MWASYLGRMPSLWYPGQLRQRLHPAMEGLEAEYDDHKNLPDAIMERVKRISEVRT
jgi:hypothetical protein